MFRRVFPSLIALSVAAGLAIGCSRTPRESTEVGEVASAGEKAEKEELELRQKEETYAEVKRTHLKTRSRATLAAADKRAAAVEEKKKTLRGQSLVEIKSALDGVAQARVALTDEIAKLDDASPRELTNLASSVEKAESELVNAVEAYEKVVAKG